MTNIPLKAWSNKVLDMINVGVLVMTLIFFTVHWFSIIYVLRSVNSINNVLFVVLAVLLPVHLWANIIMFMKKSNLLNKNKRQEVV